jgi:hypothetical protein
VEKKVAKVNVINHFSEKNQDFVICLVPWLNSRSNTLNKGDSKKKQLKNWPDFRQKGK